MILQSRFCLRRSRSRLQNLDLVQILVMLPQISILRGLKTMLMRCIELRMRPEQAGFVLEKFGFEFETVYESRKSNLRFDQERRIQG